MPTGFDPDFKSTLPYIECWSRNEPFTKLLEVVKFQKIDTVHIQHQFGLFPFEQNLTELLKVLHETNTQILTTLHDVLPYVPSMDSYFGNLIKYSDKIIVHTSLCQQLMIREWKCPPEKLHLIMHGTKLIDVPPKEVARKQLGLPLDAKIILSWGFLWESKGVLELVEVLAQLLKVDPNIMLIHAGGLHPVIRGDSYLKKILTQAFKLGIRPDKFKITGFLREEEIPLYFGACDLIVLNYMRGSASASGAAHRSLSSHRPLVGSDDPCTLEVPKLEFSRGDKQALLKAIKKVLGDKFLQEELIKKAEKVASETSWGNVAVSHKNLYS